MSSKIDWDGFLDSVNSVLDHPRSEVTQDEVRILVDELKRLRGELKQTITDCDDYCLVWEKTKLQRDTLMEVLKEIDDKIDSAHGAAVLFSPRWHNLVLKPVLKENK